MGVLLEQTEDELNGLHSRGSRSGDSDEIVGVRCPKDTILRRKGTSGGVSYSSDYLVYADFPVRIKEISSPSRNTSHIRLFFYINYPRLNKTIFLMDSI